MKNAFTLAEVLITMAVIGIVAAMTLPALIQKNTETRFSFKKYCDMSNKSNLNGYGCTAWVIYNENMDYTRCNNLSWDGKLKCK